MISEVSPCRQEKLAPPLTWAKQKSWPLWHGCRTAGRLTNTTTTQAQIQDLELADPNIYPT